VTRVAVVGLGLIGGSLAQALRARGWDREPEVRRQARERGLDVAETLPEAVAGAGIVVTAVPTEETPALLITLSQAAPKAILTDTASLKRPLVQAAQSLRQAVRFVGGHPMAGSESSGIAAARPDLFRGRPWALVPTPRSDEEAIAACEELARAAGARPIRLDAVRHDRLMTWASHLPLSVAAALVRAATSASGNDLSQLAGPGYLDTTRVAGQPVALALELALADPDALAGAIEAVSRELASLSAALRREDLDALGRYFQEASEARRKV
jgi:prephenate dehydrogenase